MTDDKNVIENTEEQIVMTPKAKTDKSTTIAVERRRVELSDATSENRKIHVAGGDHTGIIINKQMGNGSVDKDNSPYQLSLEFKVFLVNATTQKHTLESRQLRFWFKDDFPHHERAKYSQEFFKELVSPLEFPRDYVGFITKVLKLMQVRYVGMRKIEMELRQLEETDRPPERPSKSTSLRPFYFRIFFITTFLFTRSKIDWKRKMIEMKYMM